MGIILGLLAVALVFVIAAVVVGREARRLATKAPGRVFEFEDAVTWVCDHVGDEVAAVLSPDDVRRILNWHLEYFRIKGVSSNGASPKVEGPVVVSGAETVDFVLKRAEADGLDYTPSQVHAVLDAQMTYLESIGAVGPVSESDEGD
ncbi:MAG TPA: hypothetical protein VHS52_02235 [Acidimicrobiales bacterium]|jgi:hypothetical protein|nr:hypothetical protein [Acidimicrobiales bacterium]